jgi:hypothetical protein
MSQIRYASPADLGPPTPGSATDRSADHGGAIDGGASDVRAAGGGAADDMEVTGEHETSFASEATGLARHLRLTAEALGPPRWRADLSAEIQLPEAEARRSLLRRLVDAGVRFVVVGDLAEALAGATPDGETKPPHKPGGGRAPVSVARAWAREARALPVLDLCYAPSEANMRRLASVLRGLRAQPLLERSHPDRASASPYDDASRSIPAPRSPVPDPVPDPVPGGAQHALAAPESAEAGSAARRATTTGDPGQPARPGNESAPFAADPITLRSSTALALATSFGTIHVRRDVAGIGGFDDVRRRATRVRTFGLELAVLDLPALAHVRAATGTRGDVARLPMLETLLALPALEARHRELAAKRNSWIDN